MYFIETHASSNEIHKTKQDGFLIMIEDSNSHKRVIKMTKKYEEEESKLCVSLARHRLNILTKNKETN